MKRSTIYFLLATVVVLVVSNFGRLKNFAIDLIKQFEGLRLNAYQDNGGVWTIGYGTTIYPNGQPVQPGDTITSVQAEMFFRNDLEKFAQGVSDSITSIVSDNQFSALLSLAYNIGLNAFKNSTLLGLVNDNPNNPEIRQQFMRWVYVQGNVVQGLVNRRTQEANLYFS
jgi:lysozyme